MFREVGSLDELADRTPRTMNVNGTSILVVRVDDQAYAYEPNCPACGGLFEDGKLNGHALLCPFENCAYDVRSGRRVDGMTGRGLRTFPVAVRDGSVLLAVDLAPAALFAES